jgi:hypothetical protein
MTQNLNLQLEIAFLMGSQLFSKLSLGTQHDIVYESGVQ